MAPEKEAEKENAGGGAVDAAGAKAAGVMADTKAAILSVSSVKGEVLAMAPGVGLRPFSFAHVLEAKDAQQRVYETSNLTPNPTPNPDPTPTPNPNQARIRDVWPGGGGGAP